MNPSAFNLD